MKTCPACPSYREPNPVNSGDYVCNDCQWTVENDARNAELMQLVDEQAELGTAGRMRLRTALAALERRYPE